MAEADKNLEDLKYSKFCSDAAATFWNRHGGKDRRDVRDIASYTSHYNRILNKCLVDVHTLSLNGNQVIEGDHVYDALEGTVLAGRMFLKENDQIKSTVLVKDGRAIQDPQEAASFIPWYESLMTE